MVDTEYTKNETRFQTMTPLSHAANGLQHHQPPSPPLALSEEAPQSLLTVLVSYRLSRSSPLTISGFIGIYKNLYAPSEILDPCLSTGLAEIPINPLTSRLWHLHFQQLTETIDFWTEALINHHFSLGKSWKEIKRIITLSHFESRQLSLESAFYPLQDNHSASSSLFV